MAVFTTVQSGNFNDPATWDVGSGFPGSTDTFAITGGNTVTVPSGVTAESAGSISGTSTSNRGKLHVLSGGVFKQSGLVTLEQYNELEVNGVWDQNGHNLLTVSGSLGRNLIKFEGSPGSYAVVTSAIPGAGVFARDAGGNVPSAIEGLAGQQTYKYVMFVDAGNIRIGRNFFAESFRLEYCAFIRCNEFIWGYYQHSDGDMFINHVDVRDSVSATGNVGIIARQRGGDGGEGGSGEYYVGNITFDKGTGSAAALRVDLDYREITENLILKNIVLTTVSSPQCQQNNVLLFYRDPSVAIQTVENGGSFAKNGWYVYTECNNPHIFFGATDNYTDCTVENTYAAGVTNDAGDTWRLTVSKSQTCTRMILIDDLGGVLANALGTPAKSFTYTLEHCTIVTPCTIPAYGNLFRTETGGSVSGTLTMRSNLVVNTGGDDTARAINIDGATTGDIEVMDYNNYEGYGVNTYYNVTHPTKTVGDVGYGANDTTHAATFFDSARRFTTYGSQIGVDNTSDAVIDEFMLINGYDSVTETQIAANATNLNVIDLNNWVRDGYRVQNQLLENAGHDGQTIGAMGYVASQSSTADNKITAKSLFHVKLNSSKIGL